MAEEKTRVAPEVCSYTDDEHTTLTLEISIPGVAKENITLKMHEDSFALRAPREETEYVTTLSFCCPVNPDKAEARYENGLLTVKIPFKDPLEDAISVPIG
jgi:HSP20 family molecular chaperone IbpA